MLASHSQGYASHTSGVSTAEKYWTDGSSSPTFCLSLGSVYRFDLGYSSSLEADGDTGGGISWEEYEHAKDVKGPTG